MTQNGKAVLIIGAGGFIGRQVARQFAQNGWRVWGVGMESPENAPLLDLAGYHQLELPSASLEGIVQRTRPQVCVNCAGRASVYHSLEDPRADFQAHVEVTFHLLDTLRRQAPGCRLIFLSSAAVYGNPEALPVTEDQRLQPLSPYGFHKLIGEDLCREFHQVYGMPTTSVRIFSAYGIGLRRQVIWDMCQRALTQPVLQLHGTGRESRDFINGRDVARGVYLLAQQVSGEAQVYNLASGRETTIRELAELVLQALGKNIPLEFDGVNPPGNPLNWRADISRLAALGFAPEITLTHGVQAYAKQCRIEMLEP